MHAANEKAHMKCINFSAMAPITIAFNTTNEMVACMHLSNGGLIKGDMLVMLRGLINPDGGSMHYEGHTLVSYA